MTAYLRLAAWCVVAGGVLAVVLAARPFELGVLASAAPSARRQSKRVESASPRGTLVVEVTARDLFRATRRSALAAYDPQRAAAPPAATVARPNLSLIGLIDGEDATAVVEGFPGIEGSRVVRAGDVVGGLTVRRIAAGEVRIAGMDTVWVLRVRTLW